jgi:hypothetical protein
VRYNAKGVIQSHNEEEQTCSYNTLVVGANGLVGRYGSATPFSRECL